MDEANGAIALSSSDGTLLADDLAIVPVGVTVEGGEVAGMRFASAAQVDERTLSAEYAADEWRVRRFVQVRTAERMLRQWCEVEWRGDAPAKMRGFRIEGGVLAMADEGAFSFPAFVPPMKVAKRQFTVGRKRDWWWSPYAVTAADGRGHCACWAVDETREYSDRAHSWTEERKDGLRVWTALDSAGHVRRGQPQRVGDCWTAFDRGGLEEALALIWKWYDAVGQRPPKDRPEWIKGNVLYCMHPRGPIQSDYQGWGGFGKAAGRLPDIAALGCNAIWLLPVEDEWPYTPRDYYKLMSGIGTSEEYRAFTAKAHALGFRVWQDLVAHGGRSTDPRGREHPEWLCRQEDGSALRYWCFDFNNPGWIRYMAGVADHYAREYALDGFRLDVISGSKIPNWDPAIAYGRASHSQSQGGFNMGRALRAAARAGNPDAANLAEAGENVQGTVNDCIYDFPLCYEVLPRILHRSAGDFAEMLRRWLHEKQRSHLRDLVLMRFVECHDSVRSDWKYGSAVQDALMALIAWIDGFPLVLQGMEDGHCETYRRIFQIRRAVPELNGTEADYLGVEAPKGVFACRRGGAQGSVVLINFSEDAVTGQVKLPEATNGAARNLWTGEAVEVREGRFSIALPPYAFTVIRMMPLEMPPLPEPSRAEECPLPPLPPGALDFDLEGGAVRLRAELRREDGAPVTGGYRVKKAVDGEGMVRLSAEAVNGASLKGLTMTLRVPGAQRWFAAGAEGWHEGLFRVALGGFDGTSGPFYRHLQGSPVFYDSRLQPLPMRAACVGACLANGQAVVADADWLSRVTLNSRYGHDRGFGLNAFPKEGDGPSLRLRTIPSSCLRERSERLSTGDDRLKVTAGGWRWDNGRIRLHIRRNGALGAFERKVGGAWRKVFAGATVYTDKGFGGTRNYYGQENELESEIDITRTDVGGVRLVFSGVLRRDGRSGKMRVPVRYECAYELDDSDEVRWTLRLSGDAVPDEWGYLALRIDHPEGCEPHAEDVRYLRDLKFFGVRTPRQYRSGAAWHFAWVEGGQRDFTPRAKFGMTAVLTANEGD